MGTIFLHETGTDTVEFSNALLVFHHILMFENPYSRPIPRKSVLGKCTPTVEAENFVTQPHVFAIKARLTASEKADLWDLHKSCEWVLLVIDCNMICKVWIEQITFRWDSELGCGPEGYRPWIANITMPACKCYCPMTGECSLE